MSEKANWYKYKCRNDIKKYLKRYFNIQSNKNDELINGRKLLDTNDTFDLISHAIETGTPFFAGRFGETELRIVSEVVQHYVTGRKVNSELALNQLCNNAGFFPKDIKLAEKFVELMIESCKNVDLQAVWNLYMEDYMIDTFASNAKITKLENLSPWVKYRYPDLTSLPWTSALKDKKVLVVHPFEETIQYQYVNNRTKIFQRIYNEDEILPKFELKTIKAVQTISGNKDPRFGNWFEALSWMEEKCCSIDFDVAIIGCGAYGYPLSASIKRMGKVGVHLGGATQILFGIKGNRWEKNVALKENVMNEYWVKPSLKEKPADVSSVEGGCYW